MTDTTQLIDEQPGVAICPVCGDFKLGFEDYCHECRKWKEHADNLRKARTRREKFGDII